MLQRLGLPGKPRLSEWLACAGVDLHLADENIRSRHPLELKLGIQMSKGEKRRKTLTGKCGNDGLGGSKAGDVTICYCLSCDEVVWRASESQHL